MKTPQLGDKYLTPTGELKVFTGEELTGEERFTQRQLFTSRFTVQPSSPNFQAFLSLFRAGRLEVIQNSNLRVSKVRKPASPSSRTKKVKAPELDLSTLRATWEAEGMSEEDIEFLVTQLEAKAAKKARKKKGESQL
jgi:hypothetical protein